MVYVVGLGVCNVWHDTNAAGNQQMKPIWQLVTTVACMGHAKVSAIYVVHDCIVLVDATILEAVCYCLLHKTRVKLKSQACASRVCDLSMEACMQSL